jgi:hypothetical protein
MANRSKRPKNPHLVDLVQEWLKTYPHNKYWSIEDDELVWNPPGNGWVSMTISKDRIEFDALSELFDVDEFSFAVETENSELLAADPNFFQKLGKIMQYLKTFDTRYEQMKKQMFATELKEYNSLLED